MSECEPTPGPSHGMGAEAAATPLDEMADRALADALAQYAGVVDSSAAPSSSAAAGGEGGGSEWEGDVVLPLGLRQPDLVIDLEDFVSAVHSLQDESFRSGKSGSFRSDEHLADASMRRSPPSVLGADRAAASEAQPNHNAPVGVKLASAFLATFAAMTIGNLAKR